jgi:hypothetical protein
VLELWGLPAADAASQAREVMALSDTDPMVNVGERRVVIW